MKKSLMVVLAIVSIIGMTVPAMAGDWVATLEQEILDTHDVQQAMLNAEEAGADKEDVLLASLSIIEQYRLRGSEADEHWKQICDWMGCCEDSTASPHAACEYISECDDACQLPSNS